MIRLKEILMSSEVIFFIMVVFLCAEFMTERILEGLNRQAMAPDLPAVLKGIYEEKEYRRFQRYKKEGNRLDFFRSLFSFTIMIVFLIAGGFGWYNGWIVGLTDSLLWQTLGFVGGLSLVSFLLEIPFDMYATFRIEEKYGFNRMTPKTYVTDTLKELLISTLIGGVILSVVVGFYLWTGRWFWIYGWILITLFSVGMVMFYSRLIVPLFNKQVPLEAGSLRDKIEAFVLKAGFRPDRIYVMDGSKRTTKANAYFTGLGPKKRIVLYDTLLQELTEEEIVAVLAHEAGHAKKRHTLQMLGISAVQTGLMLWLFSLLVNQPALSQALGADRAYFQLGLIAFTLLYSPVNVMLGLAVNAWSRKNEYEADAYVASYAQGEFLISGLKKISVKALSNLTPHPAYEFVYYSHPSLLKRIKAIRKKEY